MESIFVTISGIADSFFDIGLNDWKLIINIIFLKPRPTKLSICVLSTPNHCSLLCQKLIDFTQRSRQHFVGKLALWPGRSFLGTQLTKFLSAVGR